MVNYIDTITKTQNVYPNVNNNISPTKTVTLEPKTDVVELSSKKKLNKNTKKKLIIGASVATGVALSALAIYKRKDIGAFINKIFKSKGNSETNYNFMSNDLNECLSKIDGEVNKTWVRHNEDFVDHMLDCLGFNGRDREFFKHPDKATHIINFYKDMQIFFNE